MNREQLIQALLARFQTVFHGVKSGIRFPHTEHDLSSGEMSVMMRLGQQPAGMSVKELATSLGITSGGVTQLIDKLVEKSLVERTEDPTDRRSVQIRPSAKAIATRDDLKRQFRERMSAAFKHLNNDELAALIVLLEKVTIDHD